MTASRSCTNSGDSSGSWSAKPAYSWGSVLSIMRAYFSIMGFRPACTAAVNAASHCSSSSSSHGRYWLRRMIEKVSQSS